MEAQPFSAAAAPEEGFSPLRVAKAGRRARAGTSTAASEVSAAPAATNSNRSSSFQRHAEDTTASASQRLSSTDSMRQRQQHQQQQLSSDGAPQQPAVQAAAAAPPVKRVGFSLQGSSVDMDGPAAGRHQQQQPEPFGFTGVSRRKQEQLQRDEQSQAKQRSKYDERLVDAAMDVPELEEEGKEDITRMVAHAPKASTPHMQAMSELEADQGYPLPTTQPAAAAKSTDINLSLLTACLLPSAHVVEAQDVWDYPLLFSQLKAELHSDAAAGGGSSAAAAPAAGRTDDDLR